MNVLLIDVDSKYPNLALMQISQYHKDRGDNVGFNISNPDKIYMSCIFKENAPTVKGITTLYPDTDISIGGSGVNYDWLPEDIQKHYPDYKLYNSEHTLGFTTRGCIRDCGFCIVRPKEGDFRRWQHITEFLNKDLKNIVLLDNNIFADKDWFFDNTNYIIDGGYKLDINQGMDIRLLNDEIATQLERIKWSGTIKFAFDDIKHEKHILRGIEILKQHGFNIRSQIQFYVLVGYDSTIEQDKYRCRLLKDNGTNAFVMKYKETPWTKHIARWANLKWIYWKVDIDEYKKGVWA